ncbi:MAG: hypothetical protein NTV22_17485 [bacterium]|nr:hypothetical protein [bacterium]
MSRPRRIDAKLVARVKSVVAESRDQDEMRAAQSILRPALMGATLKQTATVLGVGRATVHLLQTRFRKGICALSPQAHLYALPYFVASCGLSCHYGLIALATIAGSFSAGGMVAKSFCYPILPMETPLFS